MSKIAFQHIKKIKKELDLLDWHITLVFNPKVDNSVRFKASTKEALIITNQSFMNNLFGLRDWFRHACLHIKYPDKTDKEINKIK